MKKFPMATRLGVLGLLLIQSSWAISDVGPTEPVFVEATDLVAGQQLLAKLLNPRNARCYTVAFSRNGKLIQINLVTKKQRVVAVEEGATAPPDPYARCGDSKGYLLDRNGRIIRRIPVR